jgi:hypothetical protein
MFKIRCGGLPTDFVAERALEPDREEAILCP